MAKILDIYKEKQNIVEQAVNQNMLPLSDLERVQELRYRIGVIEALRIYCKTAPVTDNIKIMLEHFNQVFNYLGDLSKERLVKDSKDKAAQFRILGDLNQVHGFDPSVFAEDRTDLTTGSSWKKLPTPIKIAWFRLKYPEGRIAVQVTPLKENFMARARIYFNYKDGADEYVSEATAYSEKAFRAQSSAIGFALNYAGFGSQYSVFDSNEDEEPSDGLGESIFDEGASEETLKAITETISASEETENRELTLDEKYDKALATLYPFAKYSGKTLKEVMDTDFAAIEYLAGQDKNAEAKEAALCILEVRKNT